MKKTRLTLAALLLLCCALLCACGGKKSETVSVPTPAPVVTAAPAPTPAMSDAEQRNLIERCRNIWYKQEPTYDDWFYTITDLDHNGRLEVITASLQGTGLFTYVDCWEIDPGFTGLVVCPDNTREGEAWPDIIEDTLTFYHDPASGRYTYLCEDVMRDGAAHYYTGTDSFCLYNGSFELRTLASKDEVYDAQGSSTVRYYDANGSEIAMNAYLNAAINAFPGQEQGTITLNWTRVEAKPDVNAPSIFDTPAPNYQNAPQAAGPVTVTKNPTGETIAVGGHCWFIAHADNADTLVWQLIAPNGDVYSLGDLMSMYRTLELEALEGDTLAVRGAPVELDGWSVQARFDGPGGTALTTPAVLHVQDYTSAYGGVLANYYRAYTGGGTDAGYAYQNGISEFIGYSSHVGYAIEDLDGDGTAELVIEGMGTEDFSNGVLYDLYTLVNGKPVQIACSSARNRYYLRGDGRILNEGSSGAGHSVYLINSIQDGALVPSESVFTYFDGQPTDGYYYSSTGSTYQPGVYDEAIGEQEFNYYVGLFEDAVYIPQLTMIA